MVQAYGTPKPNETCHEKTDTQEGPNTLMPRTSVDMVAVSGKGNRNFGPGTSRPGTSRPTRGRSIPGNQDLATIWRRGRQGISPRERRGDCTGQVSHTTTDPLSGRVRCQIPSNHTRQASLFVIILFVDELSSSDVNTSHMCWQSYFLRLLNQKVFQSDTPEVPTSEVRHGRRPFTFNFHSDILIRICQFIRIRTIFHFKLIEDKSSLACLVLEIGLVATAQYHLIPSWPYLTILLLVLKRRPMHKIEYHYHNIQCHTT